MSTESVDDEDVASVAVLSEPVRLALDEDLRMDGVSSDSRAFGSSSLVYLPMEGRWMTCASHQHEMLGKWILRYYTWCFPIVFPISSVNMLNIFLLLSVAIVDHKSPRSPLLAGGSSTSGTGSNRNEADRSASKNDSRISSASTTIRNLYKKIEPLGCGEAPECLRSEIEVGLVRLDARLGRRLAVLVIGLLTRHRRLRLWEEGISVFKGIAHEAAHGAEVCVTDLITEDEL